VGTALAPGAEGKVTHMDSERTRVTLIRTGDPRVDQAIAGLCELGEIDLDDRPAVLEAVHDRLREILGELGGEQAELGAAGPPRPGVPGAVPRPGNPGGWGRRPNA
jgi:hypothetical protein